MGSNNKLLVKLLVALVLMCGAKQTYAAGNVDCRGQAFLPPTADTIQCTISWDGIDEMFNQFGGIAATFIYPGPPQVASFLQDDQAFLLATQDEPIVGFFVVNWFPLQRGIWFGAAAGYLGVFSSVTGEPLQGTVLTDTTTALLLQGGF